MAYAAGARPPGWDRALGVARHNTGELYVGSNGKLAKGEHRSDRGISKFSACITRDVTKSHQPPQLTQVLRAKLACEITFV